MAKEQKKEQAIALLIRRKGKTIFARLGEDREFSPAEIAGAATFTAWFNTLGEVRKELQDLLVAGGFKIVVPASSALAPQQAQVVVFGDMTGAASASAAPALPRVPRAPRPKSAPAAAAPTPAPVPAAKSSAPAPAVKNNSAPAPPVRMAAPPAARPAPASVSIPKPAPAPTLKPVTPPSPTLAPKPAAAPAPSPVRPAPVLRPAQEGAPTEEDRAFKAFFAEWKIKNKIKRLPKEELEELRQGEWQEVKERFMAEWRKGRA